MINSFAFQWINFIWQATSQVLIVESKNDWTILNYKKIVFSPNQGARKFFINNI